MYCVLHNFMQVNHAALAANMSAGNIELCQISKSVAMVAFMVGAVFSDALVYG